MSEFWILALGAEFDRFALCFRAFRFTLCFYAFLVITNLNHWRHRGHLGRFGFTARRSKKQSIEPQGQRLSIDSAFGA